MKPEMKARISHLHKTEADWAVFSEKKLKANDPFIPGAGELIIYDPDENFNYARVKIGDGTSTLDKLAFFVTPAVEAVLEKQKYSEIIDAGRITSYIK